MREPKPPANEQERQAALARYEILDTVPELAYDEIVELAAHICDTPIALVSLVDEQRQWFKAKLGLDGDQAPRSTSFCGHVVERGATLVVEDAREDQRFADNPAVTGEPHVVFYAGAPLDTEDGFTLGSLCVVDHRPRKLSDRQIGMLEALSRIVIRHLDLRRVEFARAQAEAEAEAARALAEHAHRLRQRFFEMSPDMLCIAGFDGYFEELNPAWTKVLGWTTEELCAQPFIEFVHAEDRERTIAEAAALGQGDHVTVHFANRYRTKAGTYRWLEWAAAPDTDNQILLAAARDITEQRERERELVEARRVAEEASEAKSDFLAKMSHELRTPLNSVIGFTNLLRKNKVGNLSAKDQLYLEKIGKNGVHLLSLINDLLDLSKIEAGRTELELGVVDLAQLCATVHDELEGALAAEGNNLRVSVPDALAPVDGDGRRLKQLLINLVGNANKFTERGDIELRVVESTSQPGEAARIDVADSGIGIAPESLDLVFEAFRQASEGDGRTHGGTGLGLAISRSLAHLHGFELGVVSVVGEGATFYLRLRPDAPTPEHRAPDPGLESNASELSRPGATRSTAAPAARQRTVLLIEDDSDARLFAAKAVEQVGARVVTADSGLAGLEVARALHPDLILLDLGLPDVHGRELVRRLSADPKLRRIPVVIYSADSDPVDGIRSTSVLEKPSSPDEIATIIAAHLGPRRRALVVDDDDDTRAVLCGVLDGLGVETLEASDGEQALSALREYGADLVLLDICMPKMSGFELLTTLRADAELGDTPVVICTALDLDAEQSREAESGARAVIRKGFNLEGSIEEVVRQLFSEESP